MRANQTILSLRLSERLGRQLKKRGLFSTSSPFISLTGRLVYLCGQDHDFIAGTQAMARNGLAREYPDWSSQVMSPALSSQSAMVLHRRRKQPDKQQNPLLAYQRSHTFPAPKPPNQSACIVRSRRGETHFPERMASWLRIAGIGPTLYSWSKAAVSKIEIDIGIKQLGSLYATGEDESNIQRVFICANFGYTG